jgi:hypothetical protein
MSGGLWGTRYRVAFVAGAAPSPEWRRLALQVPRQEQTFWCWAATSDGIARCYDSGSTWTQCLVANDALKRSDCCGSEAGGACNTYGYLDRALATVGHFDRWDGQVAAFGEVGTEVDSERPLGLRVEWSGGGAHFLAIGGYQPSAEYVHVEDPWYGPSDLPYATLVSRYQGSGSWTHTYWTVA